MSDSRKKFAFTRPMVIMSGVVTVLVLAAVIVLITALGGTGGGPAGSAGSAKAEAAGYVEDANEALASGDATKAIELAKKAQTLDPSSAGALAVSRKATAAQKKASSSGDSDGTDAGSPGQDGDSGSAGSDDPPPVDEDAFAKPIKQLAGLLPTIFPGYSFGVAVATEGEAQVSATEESGKGAARQVLWTIHELDSESAARSFVENTSKSLYSEDAGTREVDGTSAYVGTDGTRYATATYVRGIHVFEVLISVDGDPSQQLDLAASAAQAFAESPQ